MYKGRNEFISGNFARKDAIENQAFPEKNLSFPERRAIAKEQAKKIVEDAPMVDVAREIVDKHPEIDITNVSEEQLKPLCDDYDTAI